jgi:putative flippase GtrA
MELAGRGRALRALWSASDAEVLAYMDVDLSTDLNALLPLVAPLLSGHSDLAIGTRLARGSRVIRGPKRELISRGYNVLLHTLMGARFSDAQCGFKAIRRDQARALLPLTQDTGWFFDTELLVLAERAGLRIHEVPVDWIDDLDSRVDIIGTALADLRGMARLGAGFARGTIQVPQLRGASLPGRRNGAGPAESSMPLQIARFAVIGVGSTIAYLGLYLLLRGSMPAQAANLVSLLLTAVANTAANRRLTFGISGRPNVARHQFKGLLTFGIGLALTAGALAVLDAGSPHHGRGTEILVLFGANLVAAVLRFALYRTWVFGRSKRGADRAAAEKDVSARAEPVRPSPVEPFGSTVQLTAMTAQRERTS